MLNPRSIESALRNPSRETLLIDGTGERGTGRLALRIRPLAAGARAEWLAMWWRDGRRQFGQIGRYPTMSLRDARDAFAAEWRPDIEAGRDPRRARLVQAATGSVADLFQGYVEAMKRDGLRSWPEVQRALLTGKYNAADALGRNTKASDVTPEMIADFLSRVYKRGSRTAADRYRAYLHRAFQWGAESTHDYTRLGTATAPAKHFGLRSNPVSVVPRDAGANRARDRALSADELCTLWRATFGDGFGLISGPAVRLLILTGQRVLDVLRAEGCDFDLEEKRWEVPRDKRKTGPAHVVPLSAEVVEEVRKLRRVRGDGLLFPHGKRKGEHVPNQTINRALRRWSDGAGVARFQARDLRRTWKTLAGEAGVSKDIRDRVQGHALTDVSSVHYDRYAYLKEKRAAIATWSAWLRAKLRPRVVRPRRAA